MLKKLRQRFILIMMCLVLLLLSGMFSLVLHTTEQNLARSSIQALQAVAANPMQRNRPGESTASFAYFTVRVDAFGTAYVVDENNFDLSDEESLIDIVMLAHNSESSEGYLEDYHLRFCKHTSPAFGSFGLASGILDIEEEYIVFGDTLGDEETIHNLWRTCLIIGALATLAFFGASVLLARWAVKPVDKAWTEQKQFISDASHELKTPLTVILTNAELLQESESKGSSEENQRHIGNILTMSLQMRGLVESLLELARVDNGTVQKVFGPLNFSRLSEDSTYPFEPLLFEAGLGFRCDIEPDICVNGSEMHLRQVVEILLDNATKYSVAPGTVQLTLRREDHNHCRLSIFSPGAPLSSEECEKIFRRFYRADSARAMNHSYGLGLSIAESIVKDHSGRIWCEPQPKGNVFYVKLPTGK